MKAENRKKKYHIVLLSYFVALTVLFPLFFTDYYRNILLSKSLFFIFATIAVLFLLLFMRLSDRISESRDSNPREEPVNLSQFYEDNYVFPPEGREDNGNSRKSGVLTMGKSFFREPAVMVFLLFGCWSVLSALLSADPQAALTGSQGRYMGAVMIMAMVICLIILGRYGAILEENWIRSLPCLAAIAVILLGVLQLTGIDIGGFQASVSDQSPGEFLSTIGYTVCFTQYATFIAVLAMGFYMRNGSFFTYLFVIFGYAGILISNNEFGLLCIAAAILLMPLIFGRQKDFSLRFCIVLSGIPLALIFGAIFYHLNPNVEANSLMAELIRPIVFLPLIVVLLMMMGLLQNLWKRSHLHNYHIESAENTSRIRTGNTEEHTQRQVLTEENWARVISGEHMAIGNYKVLLFLTVLVFLLLFVLANAGVIHLNQLVVTDSWADYRGKLWRLSLQIFHDAPLMQKIFGYGPEFSMIKAEEINRELQVTASGNYGSAHNIIFQYLITLGVPGLVLWMIGWIALIRKAFRYLAEQAGPWLLTLLVLLIQSLFIPNQPATTPFLFLCGGLCLAYTLKKAREQKE